MKVFLIILLLSTTILANTLQNNIKDVLKTNPLIKERLKNFRAIQQDLNIAESEYYPTIDLKVIADYNKAGGDNEKILHSAVDNAEYQSYESSLTFTQNLFNGFSTKHKIDYQEAKVLVAAYKYIEKANDMAFRMSDVYIKVLRHQELLQTARQNVKINETIYSKVKELSDSGLTTDSEVKKIHSSLSLARSKFTVQKNSALEAEYNYRRVLGRMPDVSKMHNPNFNIKMPSSIESAAIYAVEHNPSLLVSRYSIKGAESLYKQGKEVYYPKLDLEVSKTYKDSFPSDNGFDTPDDRFKARLLLTYNLFRGGADASAVQKNISKINQEIELKRDLKRQVIEDLDIAWTFYEMTADQLIDLKEYRVYAEETMILYKEEYDLGRRTLLDLLTSQNDVINSREQIIKAEYDRLFAKYRILDAMGVLITSVVGESEEYSSKVNLSSNDEEAKEILDVIAVEIDLDDDNISDNIDLCDNSLEEETVLGYGCKEIVLDSDKDGVIDSQDKCPLTELGLIVSENGCEIDSDKDGIVDSQDECPNTTEGKNVSISGCEINFASDEEVQPHKINNTTISGSLDIYYEKDSYKIESNYKDKISEFANFLMENKNYDVIIVGHSSDEGNISTSLWLCEQRAKQVISELVQIGIDELRLSYDAMGEDEPIAFGNTPEDLAINRRIEVSLIDLGVDSSSKKDSINEKKIKKNGNLDLESYNLDIKYKNNQYKIQSSEDFKMQKFADYLLKNEEYKAKVIGHTSTGGKDYANQWISEIRAKYITLDLIKKGIDKSRLSYEGRGDKEPISFGETAEDIAKNRRIEIELEK